MCVCVCERERERERERENNVNLNFVNLNNVNLKNNFGTLPGGPMFNNLSANAGGTGSVPGLGRSYMLQSS